MKILLILTLMLGLGFGFWFYNEQRDASAVVTHTVTKGDTLTSLAEKYDTTVASIQSHNDLNNDVISLGQKLTIHRGEQLANPPRQGIASLPRSPQTPDKKSTPPRKSIPAKLLPSSIVMEGSQIGIDIDDENKVYLKNKNGTFTPAGKIIYGSDADQAGNEVKTITYIDLKGRKTTLQGEASPEAVIRRALNK